MGGPFEHVGGRELLAARDNEVAAQALGVAPVRARLTAFALSGGVVGLAGALLAYQQHAVLAESFSADRSVSLFLFAVIGGFGAPAALYPEPRYPERQYLEPRYPEPQCSRPTPGGQINRFVHGLAGK